MKRLGIVTAEARSAPTAVEQGVVEGVRRETCGGNGLARSNRQAPDRERRAAWGRTAAERWQRSSDARSGGGAQRDELPLHEHEERLSRPPRREMKPPAPHRADDARAELEETQANGAER